MVIQVIQNFGVVVRIGQPESSVIFGQRESISTLAQIGAIVRRVGARFIIAPVISVVSCRSFALNDQEFTLIGEPPSAIRVVRLRVLIVQIAFFVMRPIAVQRGYSIVTILAAHDFVVGADLILVVPLVPLVQCPGRFRQDEFARIIIDLFDENFRFVGHIVSCGLSQELIGRMVRVNDDLLAPANNPVVVLPSLQVVGCRCF